MKLSCPFSRKHVFVSALFSLAVHCAKALPNHAFGIGFPFWGSVIKSRAVLLRAGIQHASSISPPESLSSHLASVCPVLMRHQEKSPSQALVEPRRGSLVDVVRQAYRSQHRTLRGQRKAGTHVTRLKFNLLGYEVLHQVAGFLWKWSVWLEAAVLHPCSAPSHHSPLSSSICFLSFVN